jgi:predicted phage tail protein
VPSRFTISPPAPAAPVPEVPAPGAALDSVPVNLRWSSIEGAASYEIEIVRLEAEAETPDITTATLTTNSYSFTISGALPESERYTWRVRAVNVFGVPGAWSAAVSFTLGTDG